VSSGGTCINTAIGLSALGTSRVSVYGGSITGEVSSGGGSTNSATALRAAGSSVVSIYGGSFHGWWDTDLRVLENAQVTLYGSGFNYPLGPVSDLTGTISGTLQSGESIALSFSQSRAGQIVLAVPEPGSLGLATIGLMGLFGSPARRRREKKSRHGGQKVDPSEG
jgi:hypothetical protein